jgi:hypothetical protein
MSTQTACDSYTWNGTTYTSSGIFNKTIPNAVGCDSIMTLNLTINNSTSSMSTQTACDSYTWNGTIYTSSGTYNKTILNAAGCDSVMTLNLTITSLPSVSSVNNATRCDAGTLLLTANAGVGNLDWYSSNVGGTSLGSGTNFNTPNISSTTTYYIEATNTCGASPRTSVIATVNNTPSITATTPGTRCDAGTVTLGATASAGTLNWYAASTGGSSLGTGATFITPGISSTTTYYVDATNTGCTSSRTAVVATVDNSPSITGVTPGSRCDAGILSLGATASAGALEWYSASTGGISLGTGTAFVTPSIASTTTYYVDATNNGCTSSRTAVVATVNNTPIVSSTIPGNRCNAGVVTLGATASAGILNWYAASAGGTSLGIGVTYTTPIISSTTTYYVEATNTGCTSLRTGVIATVNSIPNILSTTPGNRCDAGSITLGATANTGVLNWYTTSTGGTSQGTGTAFITPSISATTTYYVEASNTCGASARVAVIASVGLSPTITATSPASRCDVGVVTLGATASAGALNWYSSITGGTSLGTGATYTTPIISSTTTYYVNATASCGTSPRTAVIATVNSTPSMIASITNSRCDAGTVVLGATASAGTLNWYAASTGGTSLGTGTSFTTPVITSTTTYFADATNSGCISSRTAVIATVNTTPGITASTPGSRCDAGIVTLGATASAGTLNWYAASAGGTSIGTGMSFTTPGISSTTTYYVDATNTGCTSSRTAVIATINNSPNITGTTSGNRCSAGIVTLGATASAGTLNWYGASTGGVSLGTGSAFITPSISSTTTYYVEATNTGCTSARTAVVATVNNAPSVTSTNPGSRCGTGTVTLSATASAGTLNWYSTSTGGTSLGTGATFTTPSISSTTTYYVDANATCGTSARTAVIASVNAALGVLGTISGNTTVCSGSSNTYSVLPLADALSYTWTLPSGWIGSTGTTNSINATANGVGGDVTVKANNACGSTAVQILAVNVNTADASVTQNGTTLVANATIGTFQWVDCNNANAPVSGANKHSFTPSVSGSYALVATQNGCSATSNCFTVNINVTGIKITTNEHLRIFPNPSAGIFNIEIPASLIKAKSDLKIYNVVGELLKTVSLNKAINQSSNQQIDLSSAPKGIYFMMLDEVKVQKLIVQ